MPSAGTPATCVGHLLPRRKGLCIHAVPTVASSVHVLGIAERACKASRREAGFTTQLTLRMPFVVQSLEEEGGFTTLVVSRLLDTCDAEDVPILSGTTRASHPTGRPAAPTDGTGRYSALVSAPR
jgi:hypothetical protein